MEMENCCSGCLGDEVAVAAMTYMIDSYDKAIFWGNATSKLLIYKLARDEIWTVMPRE